MRAQHRSLTQLQDGEVKVKRATLNTIAAKAGRSVSTIQRAMREAAISAFQPTRKRDLDLEMAVER